LPRLAGEAPALQIIRAIVVVRGSVLLSSAQICVICGRFGDEAQIEKQSRHAQFEARAEVVRSVARTTPRSFIAASEPLTVPTKWVKFVFGIFLLPICGVLTQTFFTAFRARDCDATVVGRVKSSGSSR
jgi:hypothetical protein